MKTTTEAERQLAKLVALRTIADDIAANDAALDYIEDYLAKRGMHTKRKRFENGHDTLLASTRPDNILTPKVLLGAHVDVVTAPPEMFELRAEGDKLIGRGTYDMKFSIAGYMQIVEELRDNLTEYDFGVMITTDEEIGSTGAYALVREGLKPDICMLPDSTAPNYDIETTAKGFWRFDLVAKGKTAHGARPWEGDSASVKLILALHELTEYFKDQGPETNSVNIGKLNGGYTYNVVPDEMTAAVEIRYLNKKQLGDLQKMIKNLCNRYDLGFRLNGVFSAVQTDLKHAMVKPYLDSVETVTGRRPQSFISCAGSDAPAFYDAGITCVISCCQGGEHHTDNEWIGRESFNQFVPILRDYLDKTAKLV